METSRRTLGTREPSSAGPPLLEVRDFTLSIRDGDNHVLRLLTDITFDIRAGETVGLLGESGAGKTTLAMSMLGLLPRSRVVSEGFIMLEGISLLTLRERELRKIRGLRISLVYQDSAVLNPVLRVGDQIMEVLRAHSRGTRRQHRERVISLLEQVEMRDVERVYAAFPHQLSGGQRQRIALAQALACRPVLVVADEPTASLDPETAAGIVALLGRLKRRFQTAFLIISHDYSILTELSDRIMIMYAGRIVEQGSRSEVLQDPLHPYSVALFRCTFPWPAVKNREAGKGRLPTIAGWPPEPSRPVSGCPFESRCQDRMPICRTRVPEAQQVSVHRTVCCFKFGG